MAKRKNVVSEGQVSGMRVMNRVKMARTLVIKSGLHASITRQAVLNHGYAWKPVAWLAQDLARIIPRGAGFPMGLLPFGDGIK